MNIVYAVDNNYVPILAVSLLSLCRYNDGIHIYVLDSGVSQKNKEHISSLVKDKKCDLHFVRAVDLHDIFPFKLNTDRGSIAQYSKLFIDKILPVNWERILYLDCDVMVRSDLHEFYEIDLGNKMIAGISGEVSSWNKRVIGLYPDSPYINSGILLIDLEKWREQKAEETIKRYIVHTKGRILHADQGAINACFADDVFVAPLRWNVATYFYDFTYEEMHLYRNPIGSYSEEEVMDAKKNPAIVHFTTSFASMRPWETDSSRHPYASEWDSYLIESGYRKKKVREKLSAIIYEIVPHKIFLIGVRIIHAYVKPLLCLM